MAAERRGWDTALHGAKVGVTTIVAALTWRHLRRRIAERGLDPPVPLGERRWRSGCAPPSTRSTRAARWPRSAGRTTRQARALARAARPRRALRRRLGRSTSARSTSCSSTRSAWSRRCRPPARRSASPSWTRRSTPTTARWAVANCHLMRDRFTDRRPRLLHRRLGRGGRRRGAGRGRRAGGGPVSRDRAAEQRRRAPPASGASTATPSTSTARSTSATQLLPGARETIADIREHGGRVVFVDQQAARDRGRLRGEADPARGSRRAREDVVTALDSLLVYLGERHPRRAAADHRRAAGRDDPAEAGWTVVSDPAEADVVVVSFDRTFDYAKLDAAYRAVRHHGASSSPPTRTRTARPRTAVCPTARRCWPRSRPAPAPRAEAVLGKPSAVMGGALLERLGTAPERGGPGRRPAADRRRDGPAGRHGGRARALRRDQRRRRWRSEVQPRLRHRGHLPPASRLNDRPRSSIHDQLRLHAHPHDATVPNALEVLEELRGHRPALRRLQGRRRQHRQLTRGHRRRPRAGPGGDARGGLDHRRGRAPLAARPRCRSASTGSSAAPTRRWGPSPRPAPEVRYCPFPGTVVGHPSVLEGKIEEIADDAAPPDREARRARRRPARLPARRPPTSRR